MHEMVDAPMITHEEMRRRYKGEWVLIVDYELDPATHEISHGRVVAHSVDRNEVSAADEQLKPVDAAYDCFRKPGEGTVLVL